MHWRRWGNSDAEGTTCTSHHQVRDLLPMVLMHSGSVSGSLALHRSLESSAGRTFVSAGRRLASPRAWILTAPEQNMSLNSTQRCSHTAARARARPPRARAAPARAPPSPPPAAGCPCAPRGRLPLTSSLPWRRRVLQEQSGQQLGRRPRAGSARASRRCAGRHAQPGMHHWGIQWKVAGTSVASTRQPRQGRPSRHSGLCISRPASHVPEAARPGGRRLRRGCRVATTPSCRAPCRGAPRAGAPKQGLPRGAALAAGGGRRATGTTGSSGPR